MGHHAISCPRGGGRTARHDAVKKVLAAHLVEDAGFDAVEYEQVVPGAATGVGSPMLDVVAEEVGGGRLAIDVTIASPVTATALEGGSGDKAGSAARSLENGKLRKYDNLDVQPFSVETHGRVGRCARGPVTRLGRHIDPQRRPGYVARLLQDISCARQRANASMILHAVAGRGIPETAAMAAARGSSSNVARIQEAAAAATLLASVRPQRR